MSAYIYALMKRQDEAAGDESKGIWGDPENGKPSAAFILLIVGCCMGGAIIIGLALNCWNGPIREQRIDIQHGVKGFFDRVERKLFPRLEEVHRRRAEEQALRTIGIAVVLSTKIGPNGNVLIEHVEEGYPLNNLQIAGRLAVSRGIHR